jgi:CDGSH-type Zn-finger protein
MSDDASSQRPPELRPGIRIANDGPYFVSGGVALTVRTRLLDDHGEAIAWASGETRPAQATYVLCRCGHSGNKPFCDGTHRKIGFDGRCTADRAPGETRRKVYRGAGITMTDDESLCAGYAFCDPHGSVWKEIAATADPAVKERLQRQVADCPSGRLQYTVDGASAPAEEYYPPTVATIPDGPLWVLGGVPVETSDGFRYEIRNRQLLCRCGGSQNKPFCDGSHGKLNFKS